MKQTKPINGCSLKRLECEMKCRGCAWNEQEIERRKKLIDGGRGLAPDPKHEGCMHIVIRKGNE